MKPTVLLIEDNEQNRYLATYLLERHGYTVIPAHDGKHALELAQTFIPDLILLDIQLPMRNGYSVARDLREMHALSSTPIIAVTSYAMPGDREKSLEAGCNGYMEKPIDPETFVAEVAGFLGKPTARDSLS